MSKYLIIFTRKRQDFRVNMIFFFYVIIYLFSNCFFHNILVYTRSIQLFTVRISSIYPSSSLGVSRINGSP